MYLIPVVETWLTPVNATVGALPKSAAVPVAVVSPVFVIPEPARTAKLPAAPRSISFSVPETEVGRLREIAARKKTNAKAKATIALVCRNGTRAMFVWLIKSNEIFFVDRMITTTLQATPDGPTKVNKIGIPIKLVVSAQNPDN
jgi:hypothetical protein